MSRHSFRKRRIHGGVNTPKNEREIASRNVINSESDNEHEIDEIEESKLQKELLEKQYKECANSCKEIKKQLDVLNNKERYSFELDSNKKLINLLEDIILSPISEWKKQIMELIEIPHSSKGNRLRGPDYFEAFFQIAFYLGLFSDIANTKRIFKNKDGKIEPNFLHEKSIKNSGGGEHGISDITFSIDDGEIQKKSESYTCGEVPKPFISEGQYVRISDKDKGTISKIESINGVKKIHVILDNGKSIEVSEDKIMSVNTTYFISVKRYSSEKSIKYYDIGDLFTFISQNNPTLKNNFNLCVCTKSKTEFLRHMNSSKSEYLNLSLNKSYGFYEDLLPALESYRSSVFSNIGGNLITKEQVKKWIALNYPEAKENKLPLSL